MVYALIISSCFLTTCWFSTCISRNERNEIFKLMHQSTQNGPLQIHCHATKVAHSHVVLAFLEEYHLYSRCSRFYHLNLTNLSNFHEIFRTENLSMLAFELRIVNPSLKPLGYRDIVPFQFRRVFNCFFHLNLADVNYQQPCNPG